MSKRKYYAIIGQPNITTGTPNKKTGSLSRYVEAVIFSTKLLRDNFVNTYYNNNNEAFAVKSNEVRGYFLGLDTRVYNEYLNYLTVDEALD